MSTLMEMLNNPNHLNFNYGYKLIEDTIYQRVYMHMHNRSQYLWLENNGFTYEQARGHIYRPVARKETNEFIGWACSRANPSVFFLSMEDSVRKIYYPNLYWVERGLYPYPKQFKLSTSWQEEQYHRECHRLLLPNENPLHFFHIEIPVE